MTLLLTTRLNVAERLDEMAAVLPRAIAIAEPTKRAEKGYRVYRTVTFAELADDVRRIVRGLRAFGVKPGMRLAMLVPPSIDFITLVFALLKSGAVQILIDPGMGKRNLVRCLSEADPDGFISVPVAQVLRAALQRRFRRARLNVSVGRRIWWGGVTLGDIRALGMENQAVGSESHGGRSLHSDAQHDAEYTPRTRADDPAAIIFTSGSTGPPKGVLYRHGNFDRQVAEIQKMYGIEPGEIDLPCFPLFGLFNAAMGVTTVLPRMNFSSPATVDPRNIVEAIEQWQVTQSFASPAVWSRVGPYCLKNTLRLNSLRRVMSAGAPVAGGILQTMKEVIAYGGEVHTPYGATEALPVASISASEVLAQTWRQTEQGRGFCVGRRFPGIEWRIIRIVDGPIPSIDDAAELPHGQIGELIVRGAVVTTEYVTRREANATAKIIDSSCPPSREDAVFWFWHRMGDCGYLDDQDCFWFCGRVGQRVETDQGPLFTIPVEARFNMLPAVARSALVGIGPLGQQAPAIVLELENDALNPRSGSSQLEHFPDFERAMRETGARHLLVYPRRFPVDVRHNAKIARERLAIWAQEQLKRRHPRTVLLRDVS